MKAQSEATIQFSGYPLSIVEKELKSLQLPEVTIIKLQPEKQSSLKKKITDDPKNWDENWFGSYE